MRLSSLLRFVFALGALASLGACQTQALRPMVPTPLQAFALDVRGRQGWLPEQKSLRFGAFSTSARRHDDVRTVEECAPRCNGLRVGSFAQKMKERTVQERHAVQFTQSGPAGSADVQVLDELNEQQREWVTQAFGVTSVSRTTLMHRARLVVAVQPLAPHAPGWRFVVWMPERPELAEVDTGWGEGQSDGNERLRLRPLTRFEGDERLRAAGFTAPVSLGFLVERPDGEALAAVSTVGDGRVWLRTDLSPELQLNLAGLASALLVRR